MTSSQSSDNSTISRPFSRTSKEEKEEHVKDSPPTTIKMMIATIVTNTPLITKKTAGKKK